MGNSPPLPPEVPIRVLCMAPSAATPCAEGRYYLPSTVASKELCKLIEKTTQKPVRTYISGEDVSNSDRPIAEFWAKTENFLILAYYQVTEDEYVDLLDDSPGYIKLYIHRAPASALPHLPQTQFKVYDSVTSQQLHLLLRRLLRLPRTASLHLCTQDKTPLPHELFALDSSTLFYSELNVT